MEGSGDSAVSRGGERSWVGGRDRRLRTSVSDGGERSQVEGSYRSGEKWSQVEGSDCW